MITKNYIKMCEKAEEIQEAWKPKVGDYVYLKKNKQIYLITDIERKMVFYINIKDSEESWCYQNNFKQYFICLPTQEQLQEMAFTENDFYDNLIGFTNFIDTEYCYFAERNDNYKNFNELWLCYVMKKKYHKIWTGKEWGNSK